MPDLPIIGQGGDGKKKSSLTPEQEREEKKYRDKIRKERKCAYPGCKKAPDGVVENEKTGEIYLVCNAHAQKAVELQEKANADFEKKEWEEMQRDANNE